ncbi:Signal transduction histidine kinase [Reichenbachiella agariperforans]|uniref:histidine kinase n=2 Tax=Reichenbachiella agariperforans TaxID=156994 RepID=A0A1M6LMM7_REIAG|nr:Signal transduction histidine kinase [Reichenbachiella agariperforans]
MRIGVFFLLLTVCTITQSYTYGHETDLIDYSQIDLLNNTKVPLDSGWVFYWKEFILPQQIKSPGQGIQIHKDNLSWTHYKINNQELPSYGFGTYHLALILPKDPAPLCLKIPKINSSTKIWINNNLTHTIGKIARSKANTQHRKDVIFLPISGTDTLYITIQVANFYHQNGGMTTPIEIGNTYKLWNEEKNKLVSDMFLVGSLMFIGLSFFIMYNVYWRVDKAILYFSFFCICWAYRTLSDDYAPLPFLFDFFPWTLHVRLEYMSLFLGGLMGSLFLNKIFKDTLNRIYPRLNSWVLWTLIGITLVSPSVYLQYILIAFFIIETCNITYLVTKLSTTIKKDSQPNVALAGIFLGLIFLSYHIYSYFFLPQINSLLINIGYLFVFMINSLLLGKRFTTSFIELKSLQKETQKQNKKIARQAEELNTINDSLEGTIADRTLQLRQVVNDLKDRNIHLEQFNYIISHNMRAPVANISGLLNLYNYDVPDTPFNAIVMDKLKDTYSHLDFVLRDLTSILEAKQLVDKRRENVYFEELILRIQHMLKRDLENANASISFNFEIKCIHSIHAFWYSIFLNLTTNAIKYRKTDTPCRIKISSKIKHEKIQITFKDNGIGIDMIKHQHEIFGLYKRFHKNIDGKGMGLMMIKTQVETMGGTINVKSKPNEGACFTIKLSTDKIPNFNKN